MNTLTKRHLAAIGTRRRHGQRGAALLTAMIIVTLIATLAAAMVWQQWRAVQVEAAERARTQAAWILSGALDWAKLILREDQRSGKPTALTEPWAVPLAESRLSTFLAADKDNNSGAEDDGVEAFLSGAIVDAQGRYNLKNLILTTDSTPKIDPNELATLERLCQALGVDSSVPGRIANGLRDAIAGTSANAPLEPKTVSQLTWLGVDSGTVQALEPYVVVLPVATSVNVNTAPREVLLAVIKNNDAATAERLVQWRQRTPFKSLADLQTQAPSLDLTSAKLDVRSSYFEITGRLRLADRILEERSLLQRLQNGQSTVLERRRIASRESGNS
ncbi:MAG TPA: type II secretion system minor pseudopilin GspK [Burkholderiaceae bacterium]|nr:type II secretion system minor pseudopilin GspK [Burkholderiaceae bacterium]